MIKGVVITGGEPTLQSDLIEFMQRIKVFGFNIKLDTNGLSPDVLREVCESSLVDYIAMDIKSGFSGYGVASGLDGLDMSIIKESVDFIMSSGVQYEFRTTVVKGIHQKCDFEEIAEMINGCNAYFLQNYRDNENVITSGFKGFSKEELEEIAENVRPNVVKVGLRGID